MLAGDNISKLDNSKIYTKDGQLITKLLNYTLVKIEVLSGFKDHGGSGAERFDLRSPRFIPLTTDMIESPKGQALFCRMVYHIDKTLSISVDANLRLPMVNQYFFITNSDLNVDQFPDAVIPSDENIDLLRTIYLETNDYNMDYCTTDLITQSNKLFTSGQSSTESVTTAQATSFGSALPTATGGSTSAAPSSGGGGGYSGGGSGGGGY